MKHSKTIVTGFFQAVGVTGYIALVALVMHNGEKLFGEKDTILMPIAFLLLFVLSAAITATLTLGRSLILYFEGSKAEGARLFFCTLAWLFVITFATLTVQIFLKQ